LRGVESDGDRTLGLARVELNQQYDADGEAGDWNPGQPPLPARAGSTSQTGSPDTWLE
jgi:hypothetical protein